MDPRWYTSLVLNLHSQQGSSSTRARCVNTQPNSSSRERQLQAHPSTRNQLVIGRVPASGAPGNTQLTQEGASFMRTCQHKTNCPPLAYKGGQQSHSRQGSSSTRARSVNTKPKLVLGRAPASGAPVNTQPTRHREGASFRCTRQHTCWRTESRKQPHPARCCFIPITTKAQCFNTVFFHRTAILLTTLGRLYNVTPFYTCSLALFARPRREGS